MKPGTFFEADIAIVGGGIAGCTLAMALAPSFSVALIDKLDKPTERIGECLAPAARRILRQLDLLSGLTTLSSNVLAAAHLTNIGTRSYWSSDQLHITDHVRNPDGYGWHLNRQAFETYLRETASQRGVACFWGKKLHSSSYEDFKWDLTIKTNNEAHEVNALTVRAKFVIDAGGRQSAFARQVGVKRTHFDKLIACWATLPDNEENKMSTISSAEAGWWYSAPLPGNRRVIALHTDPDLFDRETLKHATHFKQLAHMNREMASILEKSNDELNYHGVVAANSTRLEQVTGDQWAAIGDAAMSFDPLSSQGMFNAMAGAMQLANLITDSGPEFLTDPNKMAQVQNVYQQQLDSIWQHYLRHKNIFYSQEQRWSNSPFWLRRAGLSA
jgi:flavin-dependent dehydrogenase